MPEVNPDLVPTIPDLKKEDVKLLFSQIEVIMLYNEKIAVSFEDRISNWEWRTPLGDLFLDMMDFLKTYINYVNNYNTALATIQRLKEIPEFTAWLNKTEKRPECNNNNLESYLIMPIQRTPRYVMLLEDLLKHTPEDLDVDRQNIIEACSKMKSIATLINDKKREAENFSKIIEIYEMLDPKVTDLCEAHRQFLRETDVKEEDKTFRFLLFSDILLKVKPKDNKLKLIMHISLQNAQIIEVPEDPKNKISKLQYQVVTPRRTITVTAKTVEEKQEWVRLIIDCKEKVIQKSMSYKNLTSKDLS